MHWLNNLLFYALGFGTAFICFGCAALVMSAGKADRDIKEILGEMNKNERLEEVERREVIR